MQEKSDPHKKQSTHETRPNEHTDTSVSRPEGIVVERWGNPEILDLVGNDPSIVLEEGEVLFKEGDPADSMYIVRTGTLRIRSGSVRL